MDLTCFIRDVPGFPKPDILFRDITPLLLDPEALSVASRGLQDQIQKIDIDLIAGVESRGFIFAAPLAIAMKLPMVLIRKPGKLPATTVSIEYELEYGKDCMEVHSDDIGLGQRVVIVDDLLATGGTISAASELIEKAGGIVAAIVVLVELTELNAREKFKDRKVFSLLKY